MNRIGMILTLLVLLWPGIVQASGTNDGYADAVLSSRPAGYWRFEDASGPFLNEIAGGASGIAEGQITRSVDSASASLGTAVRFTAGGVRIPQSPDTDPRPAYSVELWAKADELSSPAYLLSIGRDIVSGSIRFALYNSSPFRLSAAIRLGPGGQDDVEGSWPAPEELLGWNHFVLVLDEPNNFGGLYVNGRLVEFDTWTAPFVGQPNDVLVGRHSATSFPYFFRGVIDELAIYQRALTPEEIAEHYAAAGLPQPCPADVNGNGTVEFNDILVILGFWGPCQDCDADLDGDGIVGFSDIIAVLAAFGPC